MKSISRLFVLALLLTTGLGLAPKALADTRYYMVMFAAETRPNLARSSHTFATFVKATDGRVAEELTISWLPAPGYFNANFTVPTLTIVPGRNYTLDQTIAMSPGRHTTYWGPFEITPSLYERARQRVAFLNLGATSYKMTVLLRDRLRVPAASNQPGGAINCIMAVSDIGGHLNTGTSWGIDASTKVLSSLTRDLVGMPSKANPDIGRLMNLSQRLAARR